MNNIHEQTIKELNTEMTLKEVQDKIAALRQEYNALRQQVNFFDSSKEQADIQDRTVIAEGRYNTFDQFGSTSLFESVRSFLSDIRDENVSVDDKNVNNEWYCYAVDQAMANPGLKVPLFSIEKNGDVSYTTAYYDRIKGWVINEDDIYMY